MSEMESEIFSIRRMGLLWNFYWPAIRRQALWSGILLVLAYVLMWFTLNSITNVETDNTAVGLFSLEQFLPSIVYVSGPLVFSFCRRRPVATTLPASWVEKGLMMLGYALVAFPAFMAAVWYICTGIFAIFAPWADIATKTIELFSVMPGMDFSRLTRAATLGNALSCAWLVAGVCYFISAVRRQRLAIGIAAIFGGYVASGIFGGVLGVVALLRSGFIASVKDGTLNPENSDAFVSMILNSIQKLLPIYTIAGAVILVMFVVLTFWKIKTRQA